MELRILPRNVADMIAAGEVVQRPASVVKELMENAVDAGASDIKVVVTDAGRTLIQVIDDGIGMSPDDALLCFERHATSKLASAEDLHHILSFGFRGEALSSIAAVAEVTLRTRRRGEELGVEVQISASENLGTREVACPEGSNFSVRNLFYNIPARRKFLKSDNVELRHIVEEFQRVALTRPDLAFSLSHNGKDIHVLKPAKSLKFRIQDLLGAAAVGELSDFAADTTIATVRGFVGRPESARKTLGNQFFFVNGRYFRSPYLHKAVLKAYENLIPEGTAPSYFIYIEVDPSEVDVNIHPTKTEIKFEQEQMIFQTIMAAVKEATSRSSDAGSIEFDNPG
ncbi:MAG: DNA mismatch repair endonuclease MutL, partial [Bacteroidales bacterium]|nr:DNA mismatch repair endonuclease MutL [Bacteroidales bacterium]